MWTPRGSIIKQPTLLEVVNEVAVSEVLKPIENPLIYKKYYGKSAYLYYIRVFYYDKVYYKVGFTGKPVEVRMNTLLKDIKDVKLEIIESVYFKNALLAYKIEQAIHSKYNKERLFNNNIFKRGNGNTEVYVSDILKLDYKQKGVKHKFSTSKVKIK